MSDPLLPIKILSADEAERVSGFDIEFAKIVAQINEQLSRGGRFFSPVPIAFAEAMHHHLAGKFDYIREPVLVGRVEHFAYTLSPVKGESQ